MIQLFTGNPGGGKSYDMVRNRLIPTFKQGREIWTNLDGLNIDYICALEGVPEYYRDNIVYIVDDMEYEMQTSEQKALVEKKKETTEGNSFRFWYMEFIKNNKKGDGKKSFINNSVYQGVKVAPDGRRVCSIWEFYYYVPDTAMVIIDEAQNYWSAKDWQGVPESFDKFLSLHRHFGIDIIFATQKPVRVYKEIQRLAEYVWTFEKLGWLGISSRYKASVQLGLQDKRVFKRHIRKYDDKYFPCYKSYTAKDIKEQKIESSKMFSPWKIAVVAIIMIFFLFKFINMPWFGGKNTYASTKQSAKLSGKDVNPVTFHQKYDAQGKRVGDTVVFSQDKRQVNQDLEKPLLKSVKNSQLKISSPGFSPVALSVNNYQGFISSGDNVCVLIGNKKTSLSDLKDAQIIDGCLNISGVKYLVV